MVFAQKRPISDLREFTLNRKTFPQGVRNQFRGVLEAFQRVWSDFQNLPKSSMFKSVGYSPGFLLKNGQFPTIASSPQIDTNSPARSQKSIQKALGGFSESLQRFPELTKIRHIEKHGLQPRVFAQKRPISDPQELTPNRHKQSRKKLEIHLEGFRRRFREFGAISRTYQNPPCSKESAIDHGICSKTANFRPSRIHPKSKNLPARSQKSIQRGFGGVSESLERFPELTKILHVQKRGLQPRVFAQKRPISDHREFTPNRHKQSRKKLEIHLEGFRRLFREFVAISRTYQNPPY